MMMLSHVSHLKINVLKIDLRLSKSNIPKNNRVQSSQENGLKIYQIVFTKIRKHFLKWCDCDQRRAQKFEVQQ